MNEALLEKKYSNFVNILLFLFPIGILNLKASGDLVLFLLMLMGVYVIFTAKINPFKQLELKLFSKLCIIYFSVVILSIIVSDKGLELLHFSSRASYFLFAPLIVLAIYKTDINFNRLILSIKLSLILSGIIIYYQYLTKDYNEIDWIISRGILPTLTTIMLTFSWVNINHENKHNFLLTLIGSIFALNVIVLSNERSAFLGFIVLGVLFIFLNAKSNVNKNRNKILAIVLFLACTSLLLTQSNLINRFSMAAKNVKEWSTENKPSTESSTSVIRLEMYKGGLLAAKERPLFGYGYRNTTEPASKFTNNENLPYSISEHNHLHNTFINTLVFGGVVALIAALSLLFLPLKKFWQVFKTKNNTEYAILGILLMSGYIVLSATNGMLSGVAENSFLVFFLSIFLPKVIKKNKSSD